MKISCLPEHGFRLFLSGILTASLLFIAMSSLPAFAQNREPKIYIALGFHVNLYHSYRLDTDDEAGVGADIRIIRHTINVLDDLNRQGLPVRGTWDFDNLFSLQEILPKYAPDIINGVKRRVHENGDKVILMSYNNALGSALTPEEFEESIRLAITNDRGSGVLDIFGSYAPLARPQEMMTTPGSFRLYKALGIKALALYYSSVTFDAFRLFVPDLSLDEAFNPLLYRNDETNEEMVIIPTYNLGDLVENGSLRRWVKEIRKAQLDGEMNRDALIFINFDADDAYWYGYDIPWYLSWLPNTKGLAQLVGEVSDLDYVEFTTPDLYLADHQTVGAVSFGQDTADGNFNGYNSWAEKTSSHRYWTQLTQDRRNHRLVRKALASVPFIRPNDQIEALLRKSFAERLRLLSTTNYGLSSPYVTTERELTVEGIIKDMLGFSSQAREEAELLVRNHLAGIPDPTPPREGWRLVDLVMMYADSDSLSGDAGSFPRFDVANGNVAPGGKYYLLQLDNGALYEPVVTRETTNPSGSVAEVQLHLPAGRPLEDGAYALYTGPPDVPRKRSTLATEKVLKNDSIEVAFTDQGLIKGVFFRGAEALKADSLLPFIHYRKDNKSFRIRPERLDITVENSGADGAAEVKLTGAVPAPQVENSRPGRLQYRLTLLEDTPYLFVEGSLLYPETPRPVTVDGGFARLARKIDDRWYEAAPAELICSLRADRSHPFRVLKRNYLGVESSYQIDYFRHSDKNLNLADVNNHITAEYAAVAGIDGGVAVAMDTTKLANFAFCPLKVTFDQESGFFSIRLNPFGTYFGAQYRQPTWGGRAGYEAALRASRQYVSSAPSYNGFKQPFSLMIAFFDGQEIPDKVKRDLIGFARPPLTAPGDLGGYPSKKNEPQPEIPDPPVGLFAAPDTDGVYFTWEDPNQNPTAYKVYLGTTPGVFDKVYLTSQRKLFLRDLEDDTRYYFTVAAVNAAGRESPKAGEYSFSSGKPLAPRKIKLPIPLQLKLLWSGVRELLH